MKTVSKSSFWIGIAVVLTASVSFFAVWLASSRICANELGYPSLCVSKWDYFLASPPNEIGDTLAGFAGVLAFVWLITAVIIQGIELKEQRLEFAGMNSQMELQRKEITFFALLSAVESAIRDIDLVSEDRRVTVGRDCFRVFYTRLSRGYRKNLTKDHGLDMSLTLAYRTFWNKHQLELSRYFRVVESLLRFVLDDEDRPYQGHLDLLRFQLSDQELLLLFYHVTNDPGENLRELVTQAKLFEQLPTVRLLDATHSGLLDKAAFGSNPMKTHKDYKNPLEKMAAQ